MGCYPSTVSHRYIAPDACTNGSTNFQCPNGHHCSPIGETPRNPHGIRDVMCDLCGQTYPVVQAALTCTRCDYDVCLNCVNREKHAPNLRSTANAASQRSSDAELLAEADALIDEETRARRTSLQRDQEATDDLIRSLLASRDRRASELARAGRQGPTPPSTPPPSRPSSSSTPDRFGRGGHGECDCANSGSQEADLKPSYLPPAPVTGRPELQYTGAATAGGSFLAPLPQFQRNLSQPAPHSPCGPASELLFRGPLRPPSAKRRFSSSSRPSSCSSEDRLDLNSEHRQFASQTTEKK